MSLWAAYNDVRNTPSDVQGHLDTFVKLVSALEATQVIELGVRAGTSTIAWLYALELTEGHLWAVDVNEAPFLHRRLTFLRGDDCDPQITAALPEADVVFVDSSHLYTHTVREIELYAPKVRSGGCIIFHDVAVERFDHHAEDEPPWPVRRAVAEAAMEHGWAVDWTESHYGLAICWP